MKLLTSIEQYDRIGYAITELFIKEKLSVEQGNQILASLLGVSISSRTHDFSLGQQTAYLADMVMTIVEAMETTSNLIAEDDAIKVANELLSTIQQQTNGKGRTE